MVFRYVFMAMLLLQVVAGCAGPDMQKSASLDSVRPEPVAGVPPVNSGADRYEWVKRLMATPTAEEVQQVVATTDSELPIPIAASVSKDGFNYSLVLNQQAGLVWLRIYNGMTGQLQNTHGPWKAEQSDAAHLLHSVTSAAATNAAGSERQISGQ